MTAGAAPLVRVVRDGLEEAVHLGHVAVCDVDGRLLAWAGDPQQMVFVRSCTKPVQAAVSLGAIGSAEQLSDRQVAVMCASHNGEPLHVRTVRSLLRRAGLTPEALRTPPDRPIDPTSAARVREAAPLFHNCSGKHAGMLLACVRAGWPTSTYRRRSHPLQRRVLDTVGSLSGREPAVGVDGCGVPVHGLPLAAVATMYARLVDPASQGDLVPAFVRAVGAMRAEPYLVGGRDRVDTAVMQAAPRIVMKEGAEALDCAVMIERGIGVAVKIADGGYRAAGPTMIHVLERFGAIDAAARRVLTSFADPPVLGGGRPVGRLDVVAELRSA